MIVYKLRDRVTGLFSDGRICPKMTKGGKFYLNKKVAASRLELLREYASIVQIYVETGEPRNALNFTFYEEDEDCGMGMNIDYGIVLEKMQPHTMCDLVAFELKEVPLT